jgi:hypothetical protein
MDDQTRRATQTSPGRMTMMSQNARGPGKIPGPRAFVTPASYFTAEVTRSTTASAPSRMNPTPSLTALVA